MKYISVHSAAEKWGLSERRIQTLCGEGRIKGAYRLGHAWAIPENAEKPMDARIKSGRYIKPKTPGSSEQIESQQKIHNSP